MFLKNGERAVISIIIQKMEGVDKNDARMVVAVGDKLNLNDQEKFNVSEQDKGEEFDLAGVEVDWIRDILANAFRSRTVPPFIAKPALSLSDKLEKENAGA